MLLSTAYGMPPANGEAEPRVHNGGRPGAGSGAGTGGRWQEQGVAQGLELELELKRMVLEHWLKLKAVF